MQDLNVTIFCYKLVKSFIRHGYDIFSVLPFGRTGICILIYTLTHLALCSFLGKTADAFPPLPLQVQRPFLS